MLHSPRHLHHTGSRESTVHRAMSVSCLVPGGNYHSGSSVPGPQCEYIPNRFHGVKKKVTPTCNSRPFVTSSRHTYVCSVGSANTSEKGGEAAHPCVCYLAPQRHEEKQKCARRILRTPSHTSLMVCANSLMACANLLFSVRA